MKLRVFFLTLLLVVIPLFASAQASISLVINNVEAIFDANSGNYLVSAYISVVDVEGVPIEGLEAADFLIKEGGKEVIDFTVAPTTSGISFVFAIDTSGSMIVSGKMTAVKDAASTFIDGLGNQDQIGLLSFNEEPKVELNITEDLIAAQSFVNLLEPTLDSGTCLWDSAYEAVVLASGVESGRRAVILLTDGVDMAPGGGICSQKTLDDVVALATDSTVQVPVYTIGVGVEVNERDLTRLAELTGGRALLAPMAAEVGELFTSLSLQLRRGYVVSYLSSVPSGDYGLFVQVDYSGARDQETRKFRIPELPATASIVGVENGQKVETDLSLSFAMGGEAELSRVEFFVGDEQIAAAFEEPFETIWVTEGYDEGSYTIRAVGYDVTGDVLAEARVSIFYQPKEEVKTSVEPEPTTSVRFIGLTSGQIIEESMTLSVEVSGGAEIARVDFYAGETLLGSDATPPYESSLDLDSFEIGEYNLRAVVTGVEGEVLTEAKVGITFQSSGGSFAWLIGMLFLIVVGGSFLIYRKVKGGEEDWVPPAVTSKSVEAPRVSTEMRPGVDPQRATLAELTVETCHDKSLVGQKFEIWENRVTLGRTDACDIIFPTQPVSRVHAYIVLREQGETSFKTMDDLDSQLVDIPGAQDGFYIYDGELHTGKPSTYETFVGDIKVTPTQGVLLYDGCVIRLGRMEARKRATPVRLRFRDLREKTPTAQSDEVTIDEIELDEGITEEYVDFDLKSPSRESLRPEDLDGIEGIIIGGEKIVPSDGLEVVDEDSEVDDYGTEEFHAK